MSDGVLLVKISEVLALAVFLRYKKFSLDTYLEKISQEFLNVLKDQFSGLFFSCFYLRNILRIIVRGLEVTQIRF